MIHSKLQEPTFKREIVPTHCKNYKYRIFPAIRRGFRPSRMTSNNLISPMKFCYNTNSTLPKQCQSSRSVLQDGSRTFGLFWKEKAPSYNRRNTVLHLEISVYVFQECVFCCTIYFRKNQSSQLKEKLYVYDSVD